MCSPNSHRLPRKAFLGIRSVTKKKPADILHAGSDAWESSYDSAWFICPYLALMLVQIYLIVLLYVLTFADLPTEVPTLAGKATLAKLFFPALFAWAILIQFRRKAGARQ
jgi:hypothetical protein